MIIANQRNVPIVGLATLPITFLPNGLIATINARKKLISISHCQLEPKVFAAELNNDWIIAVKAGISIKAERTNKVINPIVRAGTSLLSKPFSSVKIFDIVSLLIWLVLRCINVSRCV